MVTFVDVLQNSPEWFDLRVGRIGGSSIGKIMANFGKAFGPPANDLAIRIALEKLRGTPHWDWYTNAHMERGHEQEPIARKLYEDTMFCEVGNGGYFVVNDDLGCSPDGLVYDDGLIEIKSVIDTVHFATVKRDAPDPKYKWQLVFNLKCSGRDWIDYVSFCSEFPEGKRLFISRSYASNFQKEFNMIDARLSEFGELVEEKKDRIKKITNKST